MLSFTKRWFREYLYSILLLPSSELIKLLRRHYHLHTHTHTYIYINDNLFYGIYMYHKSRRFQIGLKHGFQRFYVVTLASASHFAGITSFVIWPEPRIKTSINIFWHHSVASWYYYSTIRATCDAIAGPTDEKLMQIEGFLIIDLDYIHYSDVMMGTIASQITSLTIVYSTVYSDAYQR